VSLRHLLWLGAWVGCSSPGTQSPADAGPVRGTPVQVALAEQKSLPIVVTSPGRTDALEQQKIRAPFKGRLVRLYVADGDHVRQGQLLAEVVSQESEAALAGARQLLASAHDARTTTDAERALELARKSLVRARLTAPEGAVVVSHGADEGSLVAEGQDIASLAAEDSFVFRADVTQADLPKVRPGQPATVRLPSISDPLQGQVHSILPTASPNDLTVGVRIDLQLTGALAIGLFGTAEIKVGEARNVAAVPEAALLRDDLTGKERIAIVSGENKLHWQEVTTGVRSGGWVEIRQPSIAPGSRVVIQGQVGLPEGAPLQVAA
jgi:multidrug efflux pump subunit AcrA (membrane-fusion protein)